MSKEESSPQERKPLERTAPAHLSYFGKLVCVFAVKSGMRAAAKDASSKEPFASLQACAGLGEEIMERAEMKIRLQPKMDLRAGRVCGFEAFAAPELDGKKLPASVFVPSIEMAGLQRIFDWRVLATGFALAGKAGTDWAAPISFNVSPVTLCEAGFAKKLGTLAKEHGADLTGVKIEVLEKMPLDTRARAQMRREMDEARRIGFHFSIDDFGTGDADCGMLDLPAEELKIDAFYVRALQSRPAKHWVASMMRLARDKGMSVCAEGVEHEWQVTILTAMGVDVGQGYLWWKSLDAEAALGLVSKTAGAAPPTQGAGHVGAFTDKLDERRARDSAAVEGQAKAKRKSTPVE